VTAGTINGGTPVEVDMRVLGAPAIFVTLSVDYAMLCPPGYPGRPEFLGVGTALDFPHAILAGTRMLLLPCEAYALIEAGAAVLS
jgi:hypothetical protein